MYGSIFIIRLLLSENLKLWSPKCGPRTSSVSSTRELVKMHILGCTPGLLNPKLWDWSPAVQVLTSPLGDADTQASLRTADLKEWLFGL